MDFKRGFFLLSLIALLTLTGCGGGNKTVETTPRAITVSGTATGTVIGEDIKLTALLQYTDASSELITSKTEWESKNSAVVTITDDAIATCKTVGKAIITASYEGFSFDFEITCDVAPYIVEIKFTPAAIQVNEKKEATLSAQAILSDGTVAKNINFIWSITEQNPTENNPIATINAKTGEITGIRYGNTTAEAVIDQSELTTVIKLTSPPRWPTIKVSPITRQITMALEGYDINNLATEDFELNLNLGETGRIVILEHKTDGSITDISQKITKWDYEIPGTAIANKGSISTKKIGSSTIQVSGYNGFRSSNIVTVNIEFPLALFVTQESGSEILLEWRDKFSSPRYRIVRRPAGSTITDTPIYVTNELSLAINITDSYEYTIGYERPDESFSDDALEDSNRKWITVKPSLNTWRIKNSLPNRSQAGSIIYNENIYVFGGEKTEDNVTSITNEVWQYSTSTHNWKKKNNLPTPIKDAAACEINGSVFLFGGDTDGSSATNQILMSNLNNGTWQTSTTILQEALTGASCSTDGSVAFVSGGINDAGEISNKVYRFTITDSSITEETAYTLITARHNHQSIINDGLLYAVGGVTNNDAATSSVEILDLASELVTEVTQMQTARQNFTMSIIDKKIYAFGGNGNQDELLDSVEFFTPNDSTIIWQNSGSMPFPNSGFITEYSKASNSLFLFGGSNKALLQNTVAANQMTYNANKLTWSPLLKPKDNIYTPSFGNIGNKIYFIGGRDINSAPNKGQASNQTQLYNIDENTWVSDSIGPGPLNTERADGITSSTNNRVYIFGGIDANEQYLTSIEVLGETSTPNTWVALTAELLQSRADGCAVYHEAKDNLDNIRRYIYIFGGMNNQGLINTVERYDLDTKVMRSVATLDKPRAGLSCVKVRDSIYLVGGYDDAVTKKAIKTADVFYPNALSLDKNMMDLKVGKRIRPSLTVYNDKIYAFGGISDNPGKMTGTSSTQIYNVLNNLWQVSDTLTIKDSSNNLIMSNSTYSVTLGKKIYVFANNQVLTSDETTKKLTGLSNTFSIHVRE